MAPEPEALAQIARLLGDPGLRSAAPEGVREAVDRGFERLVTGLLEEAAASDDVVDRASGLEFLEARLAYLGQLLTEEQKTRLSSALRAKIESW